MSKGGKQQYAYLAADLAASGDDQAGYAACARGGLDQQNTIVVMARDIHARMVSEVNDLGSRSAELYKLPSDIGDGYYLAAIVAVGACHITLLNHCTRGEALVHTSYINGARKAPPTELSQHASETRAQFLARGEAVVRALARELKP